MHCGDRGLAGGAVGLLEGNEAPCRHPPPLLPQFLPLTATCRTFKLGLKRWSYSPVELVLRQAGSGGGRRSAVESAAVVARALPQPCSSNKDGEASAPRIISLMFLQQAIASQHARTCTTERMHNAVPSGSDPPAHCTP